MTRDGTNESADRATALRGIVESAQRMGVELDETEAAGWVAALEVESTGGDVVVDVDSGIFGHRVSMLDFTPGDLERFRKIGEVVGIPDRPPEVLTALAISGSAAQGKVQSFPGDCDYFERIHITAPTREAACAILAHEMRETRSRASVPERRSTRARRSPGRPTRSRRVPSSSCATTSR